MQLDRCITDVGVKVRLYAGAWLHYAYPARSDGSSTMVVTHSCNLAATPLLFSPRCRVAYFSVAPFILTNATIRPKYEDGRVLRRRTRGVSAAGVCLVAVTCIREY